MIQFSVHETVNNLKNIDVLTWPYTLRSKRNESVQRYKFDTSLYICSLLVQETRGRTSFLIMDLEKKKTFNHI